MNESTELVAKPGEQLATWKRVSEVCKQIVVACSCNIDGKNYVKVEGWQSLAAMGQLTPEIESVEYVEMEDPWHGGILKGMRAKAVLKRDFDGYVLSSAYGFCDYNETLQRRDGTTIQRWKDQYAVESMAQTRAISKVCRNKLAFVITMMNAGLQTTPAEEVPPSGFKQETTNDTVPIQGVIEKASNKPETDSKTGKETGRTYFSIEIKGRYIWTKEAELGSQLMDWNGIEAIVYGRPSKNKANVFQAMRAELPPRPDDELSEEETNQ